MKKIIVFTDIHMNAEYSGYVLDPVKRLKAGFEHVMQYNADADLVVIAGDLAHKGEEPSYEKLKSLLEPLSLPVQLMIGNHDNRENFLKVFPQTNIDKNGFVQHVIDSNDKRLIFLDTLYAPPYKYPLSHMGNLCELRMSWLDRQLETAGNKDCILFMHHVPHDTGFVAMDTIKLRNDEAFYEMLKKHNNVQQIVCGHVHRTISGSHNGIPFCVFKSTVGQMPMLFDLMDFHMETDEPAAYGILNLTDDGVIVHTEDYELTDLDALIADTKK